MVFGAACPKKNAAQAIADSSAPTLDDGKASKCGFRHSASKPLVIDWPAAERAALEGRMRSGLVPVRWQGCEIEVLTNCVAPGQYDYVGLNPKQETVRIKDADQLYANLPVGAAKLEGKLERYGSLEVDMMVIGRSEANRYDFHRTEMSGRCDQATHVITGLTVGAFDFSAGAGASVGAGGSVGNVGAGASSSSDREMLNSDGRREACEQATQADIEPPPGCGALLRVELVPIEGNRVAGAGDPNDASTQAKDAPEVDPAIDPDTGRPYDLEALDRKVKVMQMTYLGSYVLALGGSVVAVLGARKVGEARTSLEESRTNLELRSDAKRDYAAGQGMLWGGAAGAVVFFGVALFANAKWGTLKRKRDSVKALGGPIPGGGQIGVEVSF